MGMLTSLTYPLPALERTNTVNDYPASQNPDHDVSELKIGGLILLSPWLTFTASSPAYTQNRYLDYVSATFLLRASQHLRPGPRSPYISRFRFYTEFLAQVEGRDLDRILPEKLWIHAGGNEILLDDTKAFVDAVRKQRKERKSSGDREEVTLEVIEGKMHNPAVLVEALEKREVGGYLGRKIERDEEGWEVRWGEGLEGVLEITEGVGRVIAEWAVENNGEGENGQ